MKKFEKKIFGKNVEVTLLSENREMRRALEEQFSYYPDYDKQREADISISVTNERTKSVKPISRNPSIHEETENGFVAHFTNFYVKFEIVEGKPKLHLNISPSGGAALSFLKKIENIEFATREERTAQILFESALIPALFFDENLFVVHSSGFVKNGKGVLIGGTGGSGKTSLELELCVNRNFSFLNDDIAVAGIDGKVYPNFAHPKIYGYNLQSFPKLKKLLFANRGCCDKLHWRMKSLLKGADKTRRRLFVSALDRAEKETKLDFYFLLFKENRNDITFEKISPEVASTSHMDIILAEYFEFVNHIRWHEFNSRLNGKEPIISYSDLVSRWKTSALNVFEQTQNYAVRIPAEIEHDEFLRRASEEIERIIGV